MGFSVFSRRERAGAPAVQVVGRGPCSHPGCSQPEGWQCCYQDSRGGLCRTCWCPAHAVLVGQSPFCPRHAPVARLVISRAGSLFELALPAVDDRALPALLELTDRLDTRVTRLLAHLYRGRDGAMVSPHANLRERAAGGRHDVWESSWAVTSGSGYLISIALRVTSDAEPRARLLRDGDVVAEGPIGYEPGFDSAAADLIAQRIYELLLASFAAPPVPAGR